MDKFSAAVIGLGVGEQHLKSYYSHPLCEKVFIYDFDSAKLEEVHSRYPEVIVLNSVDKIYSNEDIKFVSIASYDNYHKEQILDCIKYDKHIFCEKPLCQFDEELSAIVDSYNVKNNLALSSNLILRKSPRFIELKNDIQNGKYGDVYHIEADYLYGRIHKIISGWRGRIPYYSITGGGGVHLIDLVTWLTGQWPLEVSAVGNNICGSGSQFNGNDFVIALLKYESGMIVKLSSNFGCVHPHFHHLKVFGTKATFTNHEDDAIRHISRNHNDEKEIIASAYPGVNKGDYLDNFIDSILKGEDLEITSQEVFDIMSVCLAVDKAVQSGKTEKINYLRN